MSTARDAQWGHVIRRTRSRASEISQSTCLRRAKPPHQDVCQAIHADIITSSTYSVDALEHEDDLEELKASLTNWMNATFTLHTATSHNQTTSTRLTADGLNTACGLQARTAFIVYYIGTKHDRAYEIIRNILNERVAQSWRLGQCAVYLIMNTKNDKLIHDIQNLSQSYPIPTEMITRGARNPHRPAQNDTPFTAILAKQLCKLVKPSWDQGRQVPFTFESLCVALRKDAKNGCLTEWHAGRVATTSLTACFHNQYLLRYKTGRVLKPSQYATKFKPPQYYTNIAMLMICFGDSDLPGYHEEEEEFDDTCTHLLHYKVVRHRIQSRDGENARREVMRYVRDFMTEHGSDPTSLIIFHINGHGGNSGGNLCWSGRAEDARSYPTVNLSAILDFIDTHVVSDKLVHLDCCQAALAASKGHTVNQMLQEWRRSSKSNWILGASGLKMAAESGATSFTRTSTKVLKATLSIPMRLDPKTFETLCISHGLRYSTHAIKMSIFEGESLRLYPLYSSWCIRQSLASLQRPNCAKPSENGRCYVAIVRHERGPRALVKEDVGRLIGCSMTHAIKYIVERYKKRGGVPPNKEVGLRCGSKWMRNHNTLWQLSRLMLKPNLLVFEAHLLNRARTGEETANGYAKEVFFGDEDFEDEVVEDEEMEDSMTEASSANALDEEVEDITLTQVRQQNVATRHARPIRSNEDDLGDFVADDDSDIDVSDVTSSEEEAKMTDDAASDGTNSDEMNDK